jgi:anti-sigma28 factor (negative regulator of flagellin synthesis)
MSRPRSINTNVLIALVNSENLTIKEISIKLNVNEQNVLNWTKRLKIRHLIKSAEKREVQFDTKKVAHIKLSIKRGTYKIDSEKIADVMIELLFSR